MLQPNPEQEQMMLKLFYSHSYPELNMYAFTNLRDRYELNYSKIGLTNTITALRAIKYKRNEITEPIHTQFETFKRKYIKALALGELYHLYLKHGQASEPAPQSFNITAPRFRPDYYNLLSNKTKKRINALIIELDEI